MPRTRPLPSPARRLDAAGGPTPRGGSSAARLSARHRHRPLSSSQSLGSQGPPLGSGRRRRRRPHGWGMHRPWLRVFVLARWCCAPLKSGHGAGFGVAGGSFCHVAAVAVPPVRLRIRCPISPLTLLYPRLAPAAPSQPHPARCTGGGAQRNPSSPLGRDEGVGPSGSGPRPPPEPARVAYGGPGWRWAAAHRGCGPSQADHLAASRVPDPSSQRPSFSSPPHRAIRSSPHSRRRFSISGPGAVAPTVPCGHAPRLGG